MDEHSTYPNWEVMRGRMNLVSQRQPRPVQEARDKAVRAWQAADELTELALERDSEEIMVEAAEAVRQAQLADKKYHEAWNRWQKIFGEEIYKTSVEQPA